MGETHRCRSGAGGANGNRLDGSARVGKAYFVSKRKPLEAVRVVRDRAVDDAARTLALAEQRAADARARAGAARDEAAATRALAAEQIAREQRSATSARDLAQLAAFEAGRAIAVDQAQEQAGRVEAAARESDAAVDQSRASLAGARVALAVVEKHQDQARKRDDREREARIEEVAEDSFGARFKKRT